MVVKKFSDKISCFSPPAMIAIFVFEICLAIYTLVKYKLNSNSRLVAIILVLLATFQFAEYFTCEGSGGSQLWARIGYVSITMLPVLGLHLIYKIINKKLNIFVWSAYVIGFCFALLYGLSTTTITGHFCTGNYAIFNVLSPLGGYYFVYYYSLLFLGIALCLYYGIHAELRTRKALALQTIGYLSFVLPTGIVNMINPETIYGIPSIMCGFAVIYAAILVLGILPILQEEVKLQKK